MLFDSWQFLLVFLPACLIVFFLLKKFTSQRAVFLQLVGFSLAFYAWWEPSLLFLLISSILFNFLIGKHVVGNKFLATVAIGVNLSALFFFKYTNFVTQTLFGFGFAVEPTNIILPLAISFFTFQQIAYIVDSYKGEVREHDFLSYCLFVTFFPQLIAGPIVHHKEMMPQFLAGIRVTRSSLTFGAFLFGIGLFKKVILADGIAQYANPIFDAADSGFAISSLEAWGGALAYTFQLYFDFSGYADMAIGLGALFGIILPINFNSPYKSLGIIDFWRRWHITLGNFLRDYLYIPLGGNRKSKNRKMLNLFMTMFLGGIWHGAGWNFMVWGALHGSYLCINHLWLTTNLHIRFKASMVYKFSSWILTFVCVVIAWVFFRAASFDGAIQILYSMLTMQKNSGLESPEVFTLHGWIWLIMLAIIAFFFPNSRALATYVTKLDGSTRYVAYGAFITLFAFITLISSTSEYNEFIYFNF